MVLMAKDNKEAADGSQSTQMAISLINSSIRSAKMCTVPAITTRCKSKMQILISKYVLIVNVICIRKQMLGQANEDILN